jgi:NADH dehydrogenase (ubiquinone) 1 alpha subcomplex subunit 8
VIESQSIKGPILTAAHRTIGFQCNAVNDAFIRCKEKNPDPAVCLDEGFEVSRCVNKTIKSITSVCGKELTDFANCLDSHAMKWGWCGNDKNKSSFDYEGQYYNCLARNNIPWLK